MPEEEQILPEIPEPRHGRVRRLVNAVLAHHKAMRVEPFIRDLSFEYLEPVLARAAATWSPSTHPRSRSMSSPT